MRIVRATVVALVVAMLGSSCVYLARVSEDASGNQWTSPVFLEAVSGDGRYVVMSTIEAIDPADTNGLYDVYRKDMVTGTMIWISRPTLPGVPDAGSSGSSISDDGRWVTFASSATNLVPNDTNIHSDVFLRDVQGQDTTLVSTDGAGNQGNDTSSVPDISGDGQFIVFQSNVAFVAADTDTTTDIYRKDRATGAIDLISSSTAGVVGSGVSHSPSVNFDGSRVAFESIATGLVAGDTNGERDVFVKFANGVTARVSTDASGGQALGGASGNASISGNGLAVAFSSSAHNLVGNDLNGETDVFVKTVTGAIFLASVADDGVTQGSRTSHTPHLDHSGGVVAFASLAPELTGLPAGNVGAVVRDGVNSRTVLASVDESGNPVPGSGLLSADGLYVALSTNAAVVAADTNGVGDAYLRWWSEPEVTSVSPSTISLGATLPVTITGSGFNHLAATEVYTNIAVPGIDGITFSNVVVVDDTTITADVTSTVGTTNTGSYWVNVEQVGTGPGSDAGSLANCECLTVAF